MRRPNFPILLVISVILIGDAAIALLLWHWIG